MTTGSHPLPTSSFPTKTRFGIRTKLAVVTSLPIGAIAIFIFLFLPARLERQAFDALVAKGQSIAVMTAFNIAPALFLEDQQTMEKGLEVARQNPDLAYVAVFDASNQLIAVYDEERALQADFTQVENLAPISPDGEVVKIAQPILLNGEEIGRLYLGLPLSRFHAEVSRNRRTAALVSLLIFAVGMLAVVAISTVITRPLSRIVDVVVQIARGDLTRRTGVTSRDEVGHLAYSFDLMVDNLHDAYAQLEDINRNLETRIAQRTADLRREIDEHRHTEEQRSVLEEQLHQAQKMDAVGQLTAGVAHNFNNMLQVIMSGIELSLQDAPDDLQPYLDKALTAALRAADMVEELKLFSRQTKVEKQPLDIRPLVDEMVEICHNTFDRKIEVTVCSRRDPRPAVLGNSSQLRQVLLNLCINARDALEGQESEPHIEIELDAIAAGADELTAPPDAAPGPYALIRVTDNGTGMDAQTLRHLYEPFFTTKEVGKGTGLGLSTVYAIIQAHRGWITCSSEPGIGTVFTIYLPAVEGGETVEKEKTQTILQSGGETILVIDDEESVRNVMRRALESVDYTVLLGVDGADGLEVFRQRLDEIALIILDLSMPRMSGKEVLKELVILKPDIRVLIATGRADEISYPEDREVIQKPFPIAALLGKARQVLDA